MTSCMYNMPPLVRTRRRVTSRTIEHFHNDNRSPYKHVSLSCQDMNGPLISARIE